MTKPYKPKGKVVPLIQAMQDDPSRIWNVQEVSSCIGVSPRGVGAMLTYALHAGVIFRGVGEDGQMIFRGQPFAANVKPAELPILKLNRVKGMTGWPTDPDDPRIPKVVAGWAPPRMVPPRAAA